MKLVGTIEACCPIAADEPMTAGDAEQVAAAFKVLADPARVRLLNLIAGCDGSECCVCDLTSPLGLSQPTVSHHLKVLHEAGFLEREKRGTWVYYKVVPRALEALRGVLSATARV